MIYQAIGNTQYGFNIKQHSLIATRPVANKYLKDIQPILKTNKINIIEYNKGVNVDFYGMIIFDHHFIKQLDFNKLSRVYQKRLKKLLHGTEHNIKKDQSISIKINANINFSFNFNIKKRLPFKMLDELVNNENNVLERSLPIESQPKSLNVKYKDLMININDVSFDIQNDLLLVEMVINIINKQIEKIVSHSVDYFTVDTQTICFS